MVVDRRVESLMDFAARLFDLVRIRGITAGLYTLKNAASDEDLSNSLYLQGLHDAFASGSSAELRRLLLSYQVLSDSGISLPLSTLFEIGFPRREFVLIANLRDGRLGDRLAQLCPILHAMHELNLVVFANEYFGERRRVMLSASCEFEGDMLRFDLDKTVSYYIKEVAKRMRFCRRHLVAASNFVLRSLPSPERLDIDETFLIDSLVCHVRAGDALFMGALILPPLSYYEQAISKSDAKKVLVVSEPSYSQDPCADPVPRLIQCFCESSGIDCIVQSSDEMEVDAATLFYAKRVVASNSSFSKWLPLYGDSCESLMIPDSPGGGDHWVQDECITYVDCWKGFDQEKWKESLDYRLAWVSGEVQSQ